MSLTYILIDFENVQPTAADMSLIRGADYRVRLFHGPHQNKFDAEMVKALQPLGSHLEYFQCERKGKNALDFHIAFYLGRLVEESEAAASPSKDKNKFVIVSKDGGFDVLLNHVGVLGYSAGRVEGVLEALAFDQVKNTAAALKLAALPPKKAPTGKSAATPKKSTAAQPAKTAAPPPKKAAKPDPWLRTLENLRDHPNNHPTTIAALERHLTTVLGKETKEQVVKAQIARLQREGVAVLKGKKIEYNIPDGKK